MAVYQQQNGVPWGLGVQRMISNFEEEVTVIHNERVLNMRLANARVWKATQAIKPFLDRIWPGKVVAVSRTDEFSGEAMADVYPSSTAAEAMTTAYAERRSGISEQQAAAGRMGTRTPGFAAMSYMQAANRRFTPPFRNMRNCLGAAIMQCLYRIQERVRANDKAAIEDVLKVLGDERGPRFLELCSNVDDLIDAFECQITATSVSINREADRQSMLMLMNLWQSWQKQRLELAQFGAMAPTPQLKQLAEAIDRSAIQLLKRFLKSFEQLSDVDRYLAEIRGAEEMAQGLPPQAQQAFQGFTNQLLIGTGDRIAGGAAGGPPPEVGGPPMGPPADQGAPMQ
jgi:hypothetical protein